VFSQLTGTIFLERRKKIKETLIVAKLDQMGLTPKLSFASGLENDPQDQKLISSTNALSSKSNVRLNLSGSTSDQSETAEKIIEEKKTTASSKKSYKEATRNRTNANNLPKESTAQNVETTRADKSEVSIKKSKVSAEKESAVNEEVLNRENALISNNGQKIVQKEVIKIVAAAEIKSRQIETIQTVEITHDSLVLTLYDNGTVDGDTVSVLINGKVVWPRVGLLATATNKTIHLDQSDGDSLVVVMYAENLGSIAPNTGLLVVRDGDKNYEIRFSGDLQKNSAIILKRKKKP
jgi:prolyl oligopeptidase PreP (S9A serine peptidase family)